MWFLINWFYRNRESGENQVTHKLRGDPPVTFSHGQAGNPGLCGDRSPVQPQPLMRVDTRHPTAVGSSTHFMCHKVSRRTQLSGFDNNILDTGFSLIRQGYDVQ